MQALTHFENAIAAIANTLPAEHTPQAVAKSIVIGACETDRVSLEALAHEAQATLKAINPGGGAGDSIADLFRFALDLLCSGVKLDPREIAEMLIQQAAAILNDEDDRENCEALATIANRLNPTAYQEF